MAFNDNDVTEKILQFFSVELAAARFEEFCEQFVQKAIHYSGSQFLFCKYQFPHLKYDYSKLVCVSASVGGRPLLAKKKMVGASCAARAPRRPLCFNTALKKTFSIFFTRHE